MASSVPLHPSRRPHHMPPALIRALLVATVALLLVPLQAPAGVQAAAYDWPQFDGNSWHNGTNWVEPSLTRSTVGGLHRSFQATLPSTADGAPVYLSNVATAQGVKNLLFVTTTDGHIIALDAQAGAQVWSHQNGAGSCIINRTSGNACYTTSSPAIDPNRQYVYSYGLDGYVHKYQVGDGAEITGNGWPELATLKPYDEKGSPALSVATTWTRTSYLYVANGGYPGDNGDYQGHITAINLATGTQHVFNTQCSDQAVHFAETPGTPDCPAVQSAVWARSSVVYDPRTNHIYIATGNGSYAPASHDWGDSVLSLNPNGTGANGGPLDSYTPKNYGSLQASDLDLGSTAPALLPAPAGSTVRHLAVEGGKDSLLRLLNVDNLSGQGGPGHVGGEVGTPVAVPQGGEILTAPAVWVNPFGGTAWVFVGNDNGIAALRLTVTSTGTPQLQPVWQRAGAATSPLAVRGVLYTAGGNTIQALDIITGQRLWSDTTIGSIHWESPIVANGMLYVTDNSNHLTAYGLH